MKTWFLKILSVSTIYRLSFIFFRYVLLDMLCGDTFCDRIRYTFKGAIYVLFADNFGRYVQAVPADEREGLVDWDQRSSTIVYPSIYLSIYLYLSFYHLSIDLSIYLSIYICLSIYHIRTCPEEAIIKANFRNNAYY